MTRAPMMKVLVVDDSPVMRRLIMRALAVAGLSDAEVREASDGREALTQLRSTTFDLLLCDLTMPEMGGLDLLRELAASDGMQRTVAIVISSNRTASSRTAALALGARAFVHKPFRPESFGLLVLDVLEREAARC